MPVLALFAASFVLFSCNRDDESLKKPGAAANAGMVPKAAGGIGYISGDGSFRLVTPAMLNDFYRSTMQLSAETQLGDPEISYQEQTEAGVAAYFVETAARNPDMTITTTLQPHGGSMYLMHDAAGTKTCTCTPKGCTNTSGCKADKFYTNCKCTPCGGDCEKSSSSTSLSMMQVFFDSYYIAAVE